MIQGQMEVKNVPDNSGAEEILFSAMQNTKISDIFSYAFSENIEKQWLLVEHPVYWQTLEREMDAVVISSYDLLEMDSVLNNNLSFADRLNIVMINPTKRHINMLCTRLLSFRNSSLKILTCQKGVFGTHFIEIRQNI